MQLEACLPELPCRHSTHGQIDAVERAGIAAASWGLKILGVLAHIANAEIAIRSPSLPASERQELLQSSVGDLRGLLSDRRQLAAAAAEAERRQEAAGLASRLSATDLQRLCLLLHHRCIRHAVRAMAAVCGQGLHVPELQQWAQADVEQLIALEGSSTPSIYLRWRGRNAAELGLQRRAMADYEAALAACEASKCETRGWGAAARSRGSFEWLPGFGEVAGIIPESTNPAAPVARLYPQPA